MNNKVDKSPRNKKICNISLTSNEKDKIILIDNKTFSFNNKTAKTKPLIEVTGKCNSSNDNDFDDGKNKSVLKMLKMNRCCSSDRFNDNILKLEEMSPLQFLSTSRLEKNSKSKVEKTCKSKICGSCKNSSTKIKYKSHKAQLHVSIKSKKPISCTHIDKSAENMYDDNESDCSNSKIKHSNCSSCIEKETLRSDLLLHFLNQMRNVVLTKELKFEALKMVSKRLVQERKNAELLMLMDLIIRFQVSKVKEIIFQDLLSTNPLIPINFARVFLKQYEFLKSLSLAYSDILKDYESNFLFLHDLSFDLLNRAHFKIHLYDDCKEIQDLIDAGQFNVKEELIFDVKTSDKEKERIRIIFAEMKSDFLEITSKWKDVQKKTETILKNSFEVGKSLLKYFHSNSHMFGTKRPDSKKDSFDICHSDAENYINSIKEIVTNDTAVDMNDLSINTFGDSSSLECRLKSHEFDGYNFDSSIPSRYYCPRRRSIPGLGLKVNCQKVYKSLATVKAPSLSRSSSSTNSNGYNSCVSTSSFDDSSDDDDDDEDGDEESAKILYNLQHGRDGVFESLSSNAHDNSVNEETKPPTPVSFNGDEDCESRCDDSLEENHRRFLFNENEKEHSWNNEELNPDDIEKFNKLYERYLAENEHLLFENAVNSSSPGHMSVPDCIKSLQSAESLHSLLNSIMDKCKRGLDNHDKRPCHTTTHFPVEPSDSEHIYFSSTTCAKHSDNLTANFVDDNFSLDPSMIGIKDDDFEMDFEELSRTLSPNSSIHDNLKEFEKYLGRSVGSEKPHPNLHALVKTCRIYCNQFYKRSFKDESKLCPDSIDSETCRNLGPDTKQTTIVIEQISDDESCGGQDDCASIMNVDIDSNQENCSNNNISVNNNLSSSETGSNGSAGTENAGNNKVCNCCKCEMFGEQTYFSHSRNVTNVVEKLRMKLQKRKQCQLKSSQSKKSMNNNSVVSNCHGTLQDVDTLVKFINGDDDMGDSVTTPATEMATGSASKKSKSKINKSDVSSTGQLKSKSKAALSLDDGNKTVAITNSKPSKKLMKPTPNGNGFLETNIDNNKSMKPGDGDHKTDVKPSKPILKDKSTNKDYHSSNSEKLISDSCSNVNIQHVEDDKDIYDPVVEDFKRFCEKVLVVPKRRKKLPIDPTLLISELEKCQQENKSSNLIK